MTFEDMMAMKRLGDTAVSPDGKWLAYSVTTVDLAKNTKTPELWLQKIEGGEPFRIAVTQPGDSGVQFSSDGKSILFLSGRSGSQQIWLAAFDSATGATRNLYDAAPLDGPFQLTHNSVEPDNAKWSPDGKFIVFTADVYPDCPAFTEAMSTEGSEADKCNADRDKAAADSKVKAQTLDPPALSPLGSFHRRKAQPSLPRSCRERSAHNPPVARPHAAQPARCPAVLARRRRVRMRHFARFEATGLHRQPRSRSRHLHQPAHLDPRPDRSRRLKPEQISTSAGGNFNPAYSPDGKYIAWRSQARAGYESDKFRLVVYDCTAKTVKDLLPKWDNWVDEFAWGPTSSNAIYFTSGTEGEEPVFEIDGVGLGAGLGRNPFIIQITRSGDYGDLHPTTNGMEVLATRVTVASPGEGVILDTPGVGHTLREIAYSGGTEMPKTLSEPARQSAATHLNDALLAQLDLPKMQSFWFTAKDGTKVEGFLIPPPNFDPAKKYPVKFLIHGGPQGAWDDSWSYRWNPELFAANGYVVVMVNMRGSTGYGQAFVDGVNGDWGGKPFTDLMEGLDYAEQHYPFIDKNRECALGASYGGYMANWVLGHTDRFKCIVTHDGMFNAESAFGSTEELWFNIWEFRGHPWDYYGKPDSENPFRKWSPSLSAVHFKTPTLVVHSQLDYRLDVSEGLQLFTTLQLRGVPSEMLYFPDEGHWVLKPQNSQLWWKTVNAWVDKWTGKASQ